MYIKLVFIQRCLMFITSSKKILYYTVRLFHHLLPGVSQYSCVYCTCVSMCILSESFNELLISSYSFFLYVCVCCVYFSALLEEGVICLGTNTNPMATSQTT